MPAVAPLQLQWHNLSSAMATVTMPSSASGCDVQRASSSKLSECTPHRRGTCMGHARQGGPRCGHALSISPRGAGRRRRHRVAPV